MAKKVPFKRGFASHKRVVCPRCGYVRVVPASLRSNLPCPRPGCSETK